MKNLLILSLALTLSFSVNAFAQQAKGAKPAAKKHAAAESYEVPWGMAGCSIWNYVIKDKEQGPQIGVWALEHFVFGVQTFAISSGTSNCVDGASARTTVENEQEVFMSVNLASLEKEAAQGQGQHLDTLAEILGCQDKEAFAQMSQNRYEAIFSNQKPANILQNYKNEIKAQSASCTRAG